MKRIYKLIVIVLLSAGCTNQNEPKTQITVNAKPITMTVSMEKRVSQDNDFAFDLLKKTISTTGETNVFVSPLSVSIALGMAWNGANGTTKTEMETAMKMSGMSVADINGYYQIMQSTLPGIDPATRLSIANSVWYKKGFSVKPDFLKVNSDYFNAYIKELDFSQAWAVDTINNWCSKETNKLIPTIIHQIPSNAVMYLMNAVYFKGIWSKQFDKTKTTELPFTNETGNKVNVNMMCMKDTFAYAQTDIAQYLEMPYGNKAYSMTVILPADNKTTTDVLNTLTAANWSVSLINLIKQPVTVYLPRFKVTNSFNLNQELQDMGMKLAFTDFADFSNIAAESLKISYVIHNTYCTVDEEGTEAAAVTSIGIVTSAILQPIIFNANKPFLFVIREKSTGVILFIGKMGNVEKY